jgi:hypothetical protein
VPWVHEETWPPLRFLLGVVATVREKTVTRKNFNILTIDMGSLKLKITLQTGRSRFRFPMLSMDFFIGIILPAVLWPWGRLSLQQNCVPGIFPGGKSGRCVGLATLPPSCADFLKIWEPQHPGTLRAYQGL